MYLTQNITLEECCFSKDAKALKISNIPTALVIENLTLLANKCLQPIRSHFNRALLISSGYRCIELNIAIGGVKTSQHCKGEAVDFIVKGVDISTVIQWIRNNLDFDQLIDEYSGKKHWIHISYRKGRNRKQVLRYKNGVYTKYDK